MQKLPHAFYDRDAIEVAPDLLGKVLVHVVDGVARMGRIVEVEAYLGPHDRAAHSARGRTARTEVMFGPPGRAYVYLVYGMHHCMNIVTGPVDHAAAVLVRALEPQENLSTPTNGPGLVCRAMAIDKSANGCDLRSKNLFIAAPRLAAPVEVVRRPRIGVDYAGHWARRLLRFYIKDNRFVSRI